MSARGASKRSPDTCAECRARKVKCDGRRDVCSGCERLKLRCSFRQSSPESSLVPDENIHLRRKKIACTPCRSLKAKCGGELPNCQRCQRRRVQCLYPRSKKALDGNSPSPSLTWTPHNTSARVKLDRRLVLRMFEAFFQHIHPIPGYSFFHKASLVERLESGSLDQALMLALVATTCEMLDLGADLKALSPQWMSQAETLVMQDLGKLSVIKVQCLLLLIKHHTRQGRLSIALMLHALASRAAYAIGLNYEARHLGFLARESRRRLMWSLYIVDRRLAGGMSDFALISDASVHIQLPCHERNFEFDLPQDTEGLRYTLGQPLPECIGSLGIYVRLMWFRHRILHTTKAAVLSKEVDVTTMSTSIEEIATELGGFEDSLPESFHFSTKALQLRAYSSRLGPFLLVHVWLRQGFCDLYRIALTGLKEALPEERISRLDAQIVTKWRSSCFKNAVGLSRVFRNFPALKTGCPVFEHDVIACAYQCARMLLHLVNHHSDTTEVSFDDAHEGARNCLAACQVIPSSSPVGDMITADLSRLLLRGSSPPPQLSNAETAAAESSAADHHSPSLAHSNHLFSRHSAIGQISIADDGAEIQQRRQRNVEDEHNADAPASQIRGAPYSLPPDIDLGAPSSQRSLDFSASNAFEGAYGDAAIGQENEYWPQNHWYLGQALQLSPFDLQPWNL